MIPKLIVDSGEPYDIINILEKYPELFPKFEVEEITVYDEDKDEWIRVGDFTNEFKSFVVERKVIHTYETDEYTGKKELKYGDFHTSLMSKRLQDQLAKMHTYFPQNRSLMCLGYLVNYIAKNPRFQEFAYSIVGHCQQMNIGFLECYDMEEFLYKLYWINKESMKEPLERIDIKTESKFHIPQLHTLAKIPGIGTKRGRLLLEKLHSIQGVIEWMDNNNKPKIKGVGQSTIKNLVDWRYDEVFLNNITIFKYRCDHCGQDFNSEINLQDNLIKLCDECKSILSSAEDLMEGKINE